MAKVFRAGIRQGSIPAHIQNPIVTRGGAIRLVEWDNTLLRNASGDIVGTASLGRDVTDHKMLEEQYRQAQRLETVGRLAGGIAHDFNNLLTVINGYSDLLLNQVPPERSAASGSGGDPEVGRAGRQPDAAVAGVQPEAGHLPEGLKLNDIVSESQGMLRRLVGDDVEIVTVLEPVPGPTDGGLGADRSGADEPGGECQRCHARRRKATIETANVD